VLERIDAEMPDRHDGEVADSGSTTNYNNPQPTIKVSEEDEITEKMNKNPSIRKETGDTPRFKDKKLLTKGINDELFEFAESPDQSSRKKNKKKKKKSPAPIQPD
jgi:hypothetical protein